MDTVSSRDYLDAADRVAALVTAVPDDAWTGPGLGAWDLRALTGHTGRALVTVTTYLARPADREDLASPEAYLAQTLTGAAAVDAAAVLDRGRQAGHDLGADPGTRFTALVAEVRRAVRDADADALITTISGGMRVEAYLPTRTLELVVHGLDISRATGLPLAFPATVLAGTAALTARLAVLRGVGPELLEALTGRTPLPAGFTVLG